MQQIEYRSPTFTGRAFVWCMMVAGWLMAGGLVAAIWWLIGWLHG